MPSKKANCQNSMEEGSVAKIPGVIAVDEEDLVDVFKQEVSRGNTRGGSLRRLTESDGEVDADVEMACYVLFGYPHDRRKRKR